jgi:hypothetical protein
VAGIIHFYNGNIDEVGSEVRVKPLIDNLLLLTMTHGEIHQTTYLSNPPPESTNRPLTDLSLVKIRTDGANNRGGGGGKDSNQPPAKPASCPNGHTRPSSRHQKSLIFGCDVLMMTDYPSSVNA